MTRQRDKAFVKAQINCTANEHDSRRRIPCPLDPKHTVYEDQLPKHLKKCNSREKPKPVFYVQDVNAGCLITETPDNQISLSSLSKDELQELTEKLKQVTSGLDPPAADKKLCHWSLLEALNDPANGDTASKHLKQQASILGHLDNLGLLSGSCCFVEFGAGRGKLSHWVDIATQGSENINFLLVERATTRFKVDGKQRSSVFERLQIDIQHLCLGRVPSLNEKQLPVIGIGKHLCGAGTDLALRCLMQSNSLANGEPFPKKPRTDTFEQGTVKNECDKANPAYSTCVGGIAIALCCHHRCDWHHYVGREFFQSLGLDQREFSLFQRMSSWATCGMRLPAKAIQSDEQMESEEHDAEQQNCHSETVERFLTVKERESLGRLCKLLIDYGRVDFLQRMGYIAALQYYTEPEVSLENVLLTAIPR
uniref:tRNA:m(4)X modification enzyme TRM13 n=1 Tax=Xenopus tropicalis TaxID=8364 RepID=A0A803J464_XENTR